MQKNRKYYTISLYALGVGAILLLFAFFLYNLDSVGAGIGKLFRVLSPFFIGFFIGVFSFLSESSESSSDLKSPVHRRVCLKTDHPHRNFRL